MSKKPELVCRWCNGNGRTSHPLRDGSKHVNYSSEICRCCRGVGKTGTEYDVPKKDETTNPASALEQWLFDGGVWD